MKHRQKSIIVVTAYGEDNYYQKKYEDIVGMFSSVDKAVKGARKDGMTNRQYSEFNRTGSWLYLHNALINNEYGKCVQIDYEEELDSRRKPCTSSYMFRVYPLD